MIVTNHKKQQIFSQIFICFNKIFQIFFKKKKKKKEKERNFEIYQISEKISDVFSVRFF